ncbi:hypothetical protein PFISCL1PPCAC_11983, partial [Pristionchus fissidentatus]
LTLPLQSEQNQALRRIPLGESSMRQNIQEALEKQAKESLKNIRIALIVDEMTSFMARWPLGKVSGPAARDSTTSID